MHKHALTTVCAILGSTIEYYNYMLFMFLIPLWGSYLFKPGSSILENGHMLILLAALTRPFAATFIGQIGDRVGRRLALFFCACIMSLACLVMSYLPDYSPNSIMEQYKLTIILVLCCRILQNASVAGKLNGSAIYLLEHFPKYAGLMSGIIWSATIMGMCFAALAESWCIPRPSSWRFMMRIGAMAAFFGFITIIYLQESKEFINSKKESVKKVIKSTLFGKISVFCMGSSIGGMFYYLSSYIPIHFQKIANIRNIGKERLLLLIVYAISALLGGILSDRPNNRKSARLRISSTYLLLLIIVYLINIPMSNSVIIQQSLTLLMVILTLSISTSGFQRIIKYLALLSAISAISLHDPLDAMTIIIPLISFVGHKAPIYSITLLTLLTFPVMQYITANATLVPNFALMLLAGIFVGPSHKLMHQMFPPNQRYTSISLFYGIGTSIMGGASTYICLKLSHINLLYPAFYMMFVSSLGIFGLITSYIHSNSSRNSDI